MLQALGDTSQDLVHLDLTRTGPGYTAHITRIVSGFNAPMGIELDGSTLYVLETGLEGTNSSPKLWKVSLPAAVRTGVTGGNALPNSFALRQNYPNPFNPSTSIDFTIPVSGMTTLVVYDVLGRQVKILMNGIVRAGTHSVQWDGRDSRGTPVGSGVYLYRLAAGLDRPSTKKMIVVR
jgi:hypothetical protein